MKKRLSFWHQLLLLTLSMTLLLSFGACSRPAPPSDEPPKDTPDDPPTPDKPGEPEQPEQPDGPEQPDNPPAESGRYNPHADRANGQTSITLREYSIEDGTLLQPGADDSRVPEGLTEVVNQYMTHYDALGVEGAVTTFQTSSRYQDSQRINTEAVMAYVSVPSQLDTVIPSWYAAEDFYSINIMMPINRDSHDYVTLDPDNFGHIQTDANGKYITHSTSDKVYYMVPTEGWTEYVWGMVEHILEKYPVDSITFEEPEMWYASGYSDGFKQEWEDYYGDPWQDQRSSPEAMLKTMRLKVYLFDRLLSEIADRMHELSPDTKLYVASHSTASYTSISITAGLNSYLATGKIDGVIGQTWSNTASVGLLVDGQNQTLEYENAYLGYASYAGAAGDLDLFAITDTMSDSSSWTEDICFPKYRATLISALMQPEIHRFEASVWPSRGFVAVSSDYRTLQLACFEALNEMSGKAITTSAGTPGITYLLSDSLSWQSGSGALSSKDGYYGVTLPLVSDGIPVRVQSMENVKTAEDLEDVTLLLLSWDCQKPLSEEVVDAIAEWIQNGGTAVYVGGHDPFEASDAEWWAPYGTPLQALFDKLDLGVTVKMPALSGGTLTWLDKKPYAAAAGMPIASKYKNYYASFEGADLKPLMQVGDTVLAFEQSAGEGMLIAVGLPSAAYSQQTGGTDAMQALVAYACDEYSDYNYEPTTLTWTKRGRIVAAHSFADDNVLVGSFINLFDPTLPVVDHVLLNARDDVLLCDISEADLSVPRLLYSGGAHAYAPKEAATETVFCISGPNGTTISSRLACADGLYPQSVTAISADGKELAVVSVWDGDTDSLLVQIQGSTDGATVTVVWGDEVVEDTPSFVLEELTVKTNEENLDAALLYQNTGGANASFRYADATGRIVYKIDLTKFRNATVSMEVLQNYLVSYSTDGKRWTVLADYSKTEGYAGTLQGGGNNTIVSISAAAAGHPDVLYIRIADCDTSDGWGGTIKSLTITYQRYEDEPPVVLPSPDDSTDPDPSAPGTESFEPVGIDFAAKYPDREKLTLMINASSKDDAPFIVKDTSASTATLKYTDLSNEIIYRFDLSQYKDAVVVATVCQNYFVQVSSDGKTWITIQDYAAVNGGRFEGSSNETTVGAAAETYAPESDYIYLRFANADTSVGWGTGLSKIEIYYLD